MFIKVKPEMLLVCCHQTAYLIFQGEMLIRIFSTSKILVIFGESIKHPPFNGILTDFGLMMSRFAKWDLSPF